MSRRKFGSIKRLPSGRWLARYCDASGTRRAAPHTFRSAAEADDWLAKTQTEINSGTWHDPSRGTVRLSEWIARYRTSSAHTRNRPTTRARDECVLDAHIGPSLGHMRLRDLRPKDIQDFVDQLNQSGLASATVRTDYGVLRSVLKAAVSNELIARTPCREIKLPKATRQRKIVALDVPEIRALADAIGPEYRAVIILASVMGLRWSEVAGLRVRHVDIFGRRLKIEETLAEVNGVVQVNDVKTEASCRSLDLPRFVRDELIEHFTRRGLTGADADAFVFTSPEGGPLRGNNFRRRVFNPAVEAAGLASRGLTFHHLRHTCAALLIATNASAAEIQQRMGHSSIRVTFDVYGHILKRTDEATTSELETIFEQLDDQEGEAGAV